jgi:hypothetical protein
LLLARTLPDQEGRYVLVLPTRPLLELLLQLEEKQKEFADIFGVPSIIIAFSLFRTNNDDFESSILV